MTARRLLLVGLALEALGLIALGRWGFYVGWLLVVGVLACALSGGVGRE
jgi:hypothetical protein